MSLNVSGVTEFNDGYSLIKYEINNEEIENYKRGVVYMEQIEMEWLNKAKEKLKATGFEEIFRAKNGENFIEIDKNFEPKLTNSNGKDKYIIRVKTDNGEIFKWFISPTLLSKILKTIEETHNYKVNIDKSGEGMETRYIVKPVV
jgi:hypothetical protein